MKLKLFMLFALILTIMAANAKISGYWSESGNQNEEWCTDYESARELTISSAADLAQFAKMVNEGKDFGNKTVILTADIDLSDHYWTPIGVWASNGGKPFNGTFNGNGKTISGLTIKDPDSGDITMQGLFGLIGLYGTVKGLILADSYIVARDFAGAITAYNRGTITDCLVESDVLVVENGREADQECFGGIAGYNKGSIIGCICKAQLECTNGSFWGGIAGVSSKMTDEDAPRIEDCVFNGEIFIVENNSVGAIVGANYAGSILNHNFYYGCSIGNYQTEYKTANIGVGNGNGSSLADIEGGATRAYCASLDPAIEHATLTFNIYKDEEIREYETCGLSISDNGFQTDKNEIHVVSGKFVQIPRFLRQGKYSYTGWKISASQLIVDPTGKFFSFTMPSQDAVISATETESPEPAPEFGGDGTAENPYTITTFSQFETLKTRVSKGTGNYASAYYTVENDLYASDIDYSFGAIGTSDNPFTGQLDGKGHVIDGFNALYGTSDHGLFDVIGANAVIKNLTFKNSKMKDRYNGGFVACKNQGGTIENCHIDKSCTIILFGPDFQNIGGVAGWSSGYIKGCTSAVSFIKDDGAEYAPYRTVGGILGYFKSTNENIVAAENCLLFSTDDQLAGEIFTIGYSSSSINAYRCLRVKSTFAIEDKYVYRASTIKFADGITVINPDGTALAEYGTGDYAGIAYDTTPTKPFMLYKGTGYTHEGSARIHFEPTKGYGYHPTCNDKKVTFTATTDGSGDYIMDCKNATSYDITVSIVLDPLEWEGAGTEDDPYQIWNIGQMDMLASKVNATSDYQDYKGKNFKLMADLDYGGDNTGGDDDYENYTTVGGVHYFQGTFDGNGHTISGIVIKQYKSNLSQGIFGHINGGAIIKNLTLSNSYIFAKYDVAGIAGTSGYPDQNATIENCRVVNSTIIGKEKVGGITANTEGRIINCHVADDVYVTPYYNENDRAYFGGIAGYSNRAYIRECTSSVNIKYNNDNREVQYVGGILGGISGAYTTIVQNCLYLGNIIEGNGMHGNGDMIGAIVGNANDMSKLALENNFYTKEGLGGVYQEDVTDKNGAVLAKIATEGDDLVVYGGKATVTHANGITVYPNGLAYNSKFYYVGDIFITFEEGTGTINDPYLISSTAEWEKIDKILLNDVSLSGKYLKQTADINVTTMTGSNIEKAFNGNYDGNGKTLNVTLNNEADAAPFRYISGATIKNLKVTGTVTGGIHSAGLVGGVAKESTNSIENCLVSAEVTSTGTHVGGIVGHATEATITITGCQFNGKLTAQEGTYSRAGLIVGWCDNGNNITEKDCFENSPESNVTCGMNFQSGSNSFSGKVTNSYYINDITSTDTSKRGYKVISKTNGIVVEIGKPTDYSVSGIKAGNAGMMIDGIVYAGSEDTVKLYVYSSVPGKIPQSVTASPSVSGGITTDPVLVSMPADEEGLRPLYISYNDKYNCEYHITGLLLWGNWSEVGAGTEEDPYKIYNLEQLMRLSTDVNYGTNFNGKYFKLMNDITVGDANVMNPIGNASNPFQGHFDGAGHTISSLIIERYGMNTEDKYIGLFGSITNGGSIKNLTIANSRFVGFNFVGAFAGYANRATIENCHVGSDVEMPAYTDYELTKQTVISHHGGIVGAALSSSKIIGCSCAAGFSLGYNGSKQFYEAWGGIVGYMAESTVKDCLYYGKLLKNDNHKDFNGIIGTVSVSGIGYTVDNNLYVKSSLINTGLRLSNESDSRDITDQAECCEQLGVYAVPASFGKKVMTYGEDEGYEGITIYENGFVYDGMFFGQDESEMAEVSYIDANGAEQTVTASVLNGNEIVLNKEWYVVKHNVVFYHELQIRNNVNIILSDGKVMSIGSMSKPISGIKTMMNSCLDSETGIASYDLTIYGQSEQTGTMNFNFSNDSGTGIFVKNFEQNGGQINFTGKNITAITTGDRFFRHDMGSITINRGKLNTSESDQKVCSSGNITINGGQIDSYLLFVRTYEHEMGDEKRIILGWTDQDDYIQVKHYKIWEYHDISLNVLINLDRSDLIMIKANNNFIDNTGVYHEYHEEFERDTQGIENYSPDNLELDLEHPLSIEGKKLMPAALQLADNEDNTERLARYQHLSPIDVTLKDRTIYGGEWNTICLPFNLTKAEMEAYDSSLKGSDVRRLHSSSINETNDTLTLIFTDNLVELSEDDEVVIHASIPYLIKPEGGDVTNPTFKNITITASKLEDNEYTKTPYVDFIPGFAPLNISGLNKGVLYMGDENKLYHPKADMTINSFRGYFKMNKGYSLPDEGDINGDNLVSVTDVNALIQYMFGTSINNFIIQNADINGDGKITVSDVTELVNMILQGNHFITNIVINLDDDTITYGGVGTESNGGAARVPGHIK